MTYDIHTLVPKSKMKYDSVFWAWWHYETNMHTRLYGVFYFQNELIFRCAIDLNRSGPPTEQEKQDMVKYVDEYLGK